MVAKVEDADHQAIADPFLIQKSPPALAAFYNIQVPIQDYDEQQPYIIIPIPPNNNKTHLRICICCLCCCNRQLIKIAALILVSVCLLLWLLSPSHPHLEVVRVQMNHANVSRTNDTIVFLDTSMDIRVLIQNRDYISHTYSFISVLVGYRGKWLGSSETNATFVDARSTSYFDVDVLLNGTQSLKLERPTEREGWRGGKREEDEDGFNYLVGDSVPLEIVIEVGTKYHFFSINVPIEAMASCTVNVDMAAQNITDQDCYLEQGDQRRYRSTHAWAAIDLVPTVTATPAAGLRLETFRD